MSLLADTASLSLMLIHILMITRRNFRLEERLFCRAIQKLKSTLHTSQAEGSIIEIANIDFGKKNLSLGKYFNLINHMTRKFASIFQRNNSQKKLLSA